MDPNLALKLAEAKNNLFNYNIPLSKLGTQPATLARNGVAGRYVEFGEITHDGRLQDSGLNFANSRLNSEAAAHIVAAPVCDQRDTYDVLGTPSRLIGRGPMLITK